MSTEDKRSDSEVEFHDTDVSLRHMSLEGNISGSASRSSRVDGHLSTLDEPVKDTIVTIGGLFFGYMLYIPVMRDVKAVGRKFFHVLYPKESTTLLREWDLWGPLVLCTIMGILLQGNADLVNHPNDGGPQFPEVIFIFWVGASIVTLNIQLLGGDISFLQSVCVLGYCVLPLTLSLIFSRIILLLPQSTILSIIRLVVALIGFGWATFASTAFLASRHLAQRKALCVYPICLFYFVMAWLVISQTHV